MGEIERFGAIVLVVAAALAAAVLATGSSRRLPLPVAAIFLAGAALAAGLHPSLHHAIDIATVSRIGVVALIVILFDGGMGIGWRQLRGSLRPVAALGIGGTFVTAVAIAGLAHFALGLRSISAGLIGAAVAPTDPAVMFSVLGPHRLPGRTGTILEGESGANDPVGIALVVGLLDLARSPHGSATIVLREFALEIAIGLLVGLVAGRLLTAALPRLTALLQPATAPILILALAAAVYGTATVGGGSGFLAVFIAGLMVGDLELPHAAELNAFRLVLASLAEITVFVLLGLTVRAGTLDQPSVWLDGLAIAAALELAVRPAVTLTLLWPARMPRPQKLFIAWAGLRGAVPILLAAFAVLDGVRDAERMYGIVFVVVLSSVALQGSTIPWAVRRLGRTTA